MGRVGQGRDRQSRKASQLHLQQMDMDFTLESAAEHENFWYI